MIRDMKLAEGGIKLLGMHARWLVKGVGKTKLITFGIILILLSSSTLIFIRTSQSAESVCTKPSLGTFAFYYPWYGTPSVSGYWHGWNDSGHNPDNVTDGRSDIAATNYPLLGVYDSNNETMIDQQVNEARNAGINCFVVSWWGINDFTDNASKHIMNVCERDDFNFTFYIENTASISQTVEDLTYLFSTYGNSSSWYRVDGRPVIFVYQRARDELLPQTWIWHACTDSIGVDSSPNQTESASIQWLPAEEVRTPPRLGIIPFQPFKTTPGYVETANSTYLPPNEQYTLHIGVSDIRNDSGDLSQVGIEVKIGTDPTCNDTLYNQTLHFSDGWQDLSFNITAYAGQDVYLKAESYAVGWSSEWAAVDYFYITNSSGRIVSPDPFFDNGWNETIYEIRAEGYNPYVIMDFGGYESEVLGFLDYFSNCIDGIHVYNPLGFSNNPLDVYDLYSQACELAHSYNKTFIATVVPGFNNIVASNYSPASLESVVDRRKGVCYSLFWLIAKASHPDGYAITSFNEWHEGTEIEPSIEYGDQYLNLTRKYLSAGASVTVPARAHTMVENAVNFLLNTQFNQSLGFCRVAPNDAPNTYYLVSDNLWAWKALSLASESGLSNAVQAGATAGTIRAKLIELAANYNLPNDSNGLPISYAHEAVIGDEVPLPFQGGADYTLYQDDHVLKTTLYNVTNSNPIWWYRYSDLLLYAALSCHWQGNDSEALVYYNSATNMWNETAVGFQDVVANITGLYNTYKLALFLYTSKVLGQSPTFLPEVVDRIYALQNETNGGIITDYYANGTAAQDADANTETTSIVIIAFLYHDVSIDGVITSKSVVGKAYSMNITVTTADVGDFTETCAITAYANTTIIASQNVTLSSGDSANVTFTWDTTGFAYGNYTLSAYAFPVPGEINTANNNCTGGWVIVSIIGDITGPSGVPDGKVDMIDIGYVVQCFGNTSSRSNWNANADINGDGTVNMKDIALVARNFGNHT